MLNALVPFLIIVLVALAGMVGKFGFDISRYVRNYLMAKLGEFNYSFFRKIVQDTVLALMQHPAYKDLMNEEKKQLAITLIVQKLNDYGLPFTVDEVDNMVEAVIAEIKKTYLSSNVLETAGPV